MPWRTMHAQPHSTQLLHPEAPALRATTPSNLFLAHGYALLLLRFLAANLLIRIADALPLVGLWRAERPDVRRNLAE